METKCLAEYRLSRLMLGTVQFGLPYGVANRAGQPSFKQVQEMVAAALDGGINCFDTAAAYGCSEEVLGSALHALGAGERVVVVTKVKALTPDELADAKLAARVIEESVHESRRRLRIDCLPIVLFHREIDARYLHVLEELKLKGHLRHAGVSCGNRPGQAARFVSEGRSSALQLPGNILDHRHQYSGIFREAATNGVGVFIRSIYLQGLLLIPEQAVPPFLRDVIPVRRRLTTIAAEAGLTLAELALRYMLSLEGVTSILTGVDNMTQMQQNIALFNRGPLTPDLLTAIPNAVPELPETVLTPALWPTSSPPEK